MRHPHFGRGRDGRLRRDIAGIGLGGLRCLPRGEYSPEMRGELWARVRILRGCNQDLALGIVTVSVPFLNLVRIPEAFTGPGKVRAFWKLLA